MQRVRIFAYIVNAGYLKNISFRGGRKLKGVWDTQIVQVYVCICVYGSTAVKMVEWLCN